MSAQRFPPDSPQEWLNRARSNLSQAQGGSVFADVYLEDLCFQAQQAAEKALKAVLIALHVRFPYTHDLANLVSLLGNAGCAVPEQLQLAALTDYAVEARYPGVAEPVTNEEYEQAVTAAVEAVRWAEQKIDSLATDIGDMTDRSVREEAAEEDL